MRPTEKAEELLGRFREHADGDKFISAKRCALIAVDELILNSHSNYLVNYWQEVKQAIINY